MAVMYYGSPVSEHIDRTPEGFLVCRDVPVARTGPQQYLAREMQLDGDPEQLITVNRNPEDVFEATTLASLEGKPVTDGHPPENVGPENYSAYMKGTVRNVRRDGEHIVADLIIYDPCLANEIETGAKREVSCGYTCNYVPDGAGYKQTHIRLNHVAVVPKGRAGHEVAIHDAAPEAEKGRKHMKKETKEAFLRWLGLAAQDAEPAELDQMAKDGAAVLDAEPAAPAVQDAEPAAAETAAEPTTDSGAGCSNPVLDGINELKAMLAALTPKAEAPAAEAESEDGIGKLIKTLAGGEGEKSITLPIENGDACMDGAARDAALNILRKAQPAVAAIKDPAERQRVSDALISAIQTKDNLDAISAAATDSAKAAADASNKTTYEQRCADSESAYAARNPHKHKED